MLLKPKAEKVSLTLASGENFRVMERKKAEKVESLGEEMSEEPSEEAVMSAQTKGMQDTKRTVQKHYWMKEEVTQYLTHAQLG